MFQQIPHIRILFLLACSSASICSGSWQHENIFRLGSRLLNERNALRSAAKAHEIEHDGHNNPLKSLSTFLAIDPVSSPLGWQTPVSARSRRVAAKNGLAAQAGVVGRRAILGAGLAALGGLCLPDFAVKPARADEEDLVEVYFGCGCFWHVQHEFVQAERNILKRSDKSLTALSGYAGGVRGAMDGKVCYHNAAGISDYGALGHAEVVRLTIPPSSFRAFAKEYFALFNDKGERPDQFGDRGPEYRNVVGVPGGRDSPLIKELIEVSSANGDKLDFAFGKGDDPDKRAISFVMDSNKFPFYQAEVYHQFHNGFKFDEFYGPKYNGLAQSLLAQGSVKNQGCPNGALGLGIGGL